MTRTRLSAGALALALVAGVAAPAAVLAQDVPPAAAERSSPFGVGFQSSWPAYGLSGIYDVNERITAQAVLGFFGAVSTVSGRGIYRFTVEPKYNLFGYGQVGAWRYSYHTLGLDLRRTRASETALGLAGGAGVELDWRAIVSDDGSFPPLFSTIDIGLGFSSFDVYNWSALMMGFGLHYRF